jgi:hypothetical protein
MLGFCLIAVNLSYEGLIVGKLWVKPKAASTLSLDSEGGLQRSRVCVRRDSLLLRTIS